MPNDHRKHNSCREDTSEEASRVEPYESVRKKRIDSVVTIQSMK